MKFYITRVLLLLALPLSFATRGSASSLQGKVAAVLDGERITVVSLNSPVQIKLLGVAAPTTNQPYTDIARQHLSDLVLQKYVVVRITTLGHDGYLSGQVMLNNLDVGAQMIRDGVAWYDKSDSSGLSEEDRGQYEGCEQASRKERRGLWQDESPKAPWEFREAQLARSNAFAASASLSQGRARNASRPGLSSEDMMGGLLRPGTRAAKPTVKVISPHSPPNAWVAFENQQFSMLVPGNSVEVSEPIWETDGKIGDAHSIIGTKDGAAYTLAWLKEPNDSQTDIAAADAIIAKVISGMNSLIVRGGAGATMTARPGRDLRLAGYGGRQYSVSGWLSGTVRVVSRAVGDERQEFVFCVLYLPGFESSGEQFLNSFKIRQNHLQ